MAFRDDPKVARVSAALAAAGAFDTTPIELAVNVQDDITFHFGYTRGGAAGGFKYKVEFSIDKIKWAQVAFVEAVAIVAGADQVNKTQRTSLNYVATGATKERFTSPTFKCAAGRFCRISAAETGNVGAPGTLEIDAFIVGGAG